MSGELAVEFLAVSADDLEALADLRVAAMRASLERVGRFDPERARDRLRRSFAPAHTWAIVANAERVGFYTLRPTSEGLSLDHLYLIPEFQGRGCGAAALRRIVAEADATNQPVRVGALKESPANRFYVRRGFVKTHETEWDVYYLRPAAR